MALGSNGVQPNETGALDREAARRQFDMRRSSVTSGNRGNLGKCKLSVDDRPMRKQLSTSVPSEMNSHASRAETIDLALQQSTHPVPAVHQINSSLVRQVKQFDGLRNASARKPPHTIFAAEGGEGRMGRWFSGTVS